MKTGYKSKTQEKNVAWFLPRPKPDHYKGRREREGGGDYQEQQQGSVY